MIADGTGTIRTLSLGKLGEPEWLLMSADIPSRYQAPLSLVSIQLYEPGFGPVGTPGQLLLDEIHATIGPDGEEHVLEDFEGQINWTPIITSQLSSDRISTTGFDAYEGARMGLFTFGKENVRGHSRYIPESHWRPGPCSS